MSHAQGRRESATGGAASASTEPSRVIAALARDQVSLDLKTVDLCFLAGQIAKLLSADWFSAVGRCQLLLDSTTSKLNELNAILLRDTNQFHALLQDIQALAETAENNEAVETVQRVIEHVDRIAAWGSVRQQAWSEYYQYVHRYLRDVVRLDPDRALSQRLRDQAAGWPASPFHLLVAHAPAMRLLRALEARVERPAVERPLTEREAEPEWVEPENVHADIETLVREAIDDGAATLSEVSERVLPKLPESLHYAAAGRIADAALRLARVPSEHERPRERPWAPVVSHLEVEDWSVDGR